MRDKATSALRRCSDRNDNRGCSGFLRRWFLANSLVAGILALAWLVLRSGPKPSRLTYPCQQAAVSAATLAFGAPVVATLLAIRRQLAWVLRERRAVVFSTLGLAATICLWAVLSPTAAGRRAILSSPPGYRAQVFHVSNCPPLPLNDRFPGLDALIHNMGTAGTRLHRSVQQSATSGPDGLFSADDTVVIKINYQWSERGGTNTDVLRGLIRWLVDHPDGFSGEIVVCENAQFVSTSSFNRPYNNAEDVAQSPHDVVVDFQLEGHAVSHFDWTALRNVAVDEYAANDMQDGYVVYPYDSELSGRVSYPKFQTGYGTHISLRDGIWDPDAQTYDAERLKFINVPVLKSHSIYGVTACVKDYMGVVTSSLSTSSHGAVANGILGALLGEIRPADLNILDCVWVNGIPGNGPSTSYEQATRRDELVASVDPIAADIWAVHNILIPTFVDNGYSNYTSADPDNPNGAFRNYLDRSMNYILEAGYDVTNAPVNIDAHSWDAQGTCAKARDCADLDGNGIRDDNCIWWACEAGTCIGTDIVFGDMGGQFGMCPIDGSADGNDRFHVLNCFANTDPDGGPEDPYRCEDDPPEAFNVDVAGPFGDCNPDGVCDGNDAFAALDAFGGTTSCSCPLDGGPMPDMPSAPEVLDRVTVELVPQRQQVTSRDTLEMDIYITGGVSDLRGYQLHFAASRGLELTGIFVDQRTDHVFDGMTYWEAHNLATNQLLVGIHGAGVPVKVERSYLATLVYRVTARTGPLIVDLLHDDSDPAHRTFLFPTVPRGKIEIGQTVPAVIDVRQRPRSDATIRTLPGT